MRSPRLAKRNKEPFDATNPPSLKTLALRHLSRREHTTYELTQKLIPYAESPAAVELIVEEFTVKGWLSDTRAAEQLAHARRSRYGEMRIRRDMQLKGVPEEAVVATLANLKHSEADAAKQVWQRKYQQAPQSTGERQKQMRFLLGRGFNMAVVNQLLRELSAHAESDR